MTVFGAASSFVNMARFVVVITLLAPSTLTAANYEVKKVSDSVYAAIAKPGSKALSNAMIVISGQEAILAGSHFVAEGVEELADEIGKIAAKGVTRVVLTHHHPGFNYVDFDLPEKAEVIVTVQIFKSVRGESREFRNSTLVFDESLTLNRGRTSIVLLNMGKGHSEGDMVVYLPREGVLFASDLLFSDAMGYMGEASVFEWGETLERLEELSAKVVIPGVGAVTDGSGITRFKKFFRDFMSEVLRNLEKGNSISRTKKEFSLDAYKDMPGYSTFVEVNLERAYNQLKSH